MRGGVQVAVHTDIEDEGQTVEVDEPEIGTKATDAIDGDKELVAGPEAKVVDTVSYSNLVPGKEYKLTGVLMDKETGEPLASADGNPVTAEKTFTPAAAS